MSRHPLLRYGVACSMLLVLCFLHACSSSSTPTPSAAVVADSSAKAMNHGWQEVHTQDGGVMKGELSDGKRIGEWTAYFSDGTVRSRQSYVDGLKEGVAEVYHPGGALYYSGQYSADKAVGAWYFYDDGGTLTRTAIHDSLGKLLEQR